MIFKRYLMEEQSNSKEKKGFLFYFHIFFVLAILGIIIAVVIKFKNWGISVDLNEIRAQGEGEYSDTLDTILPLVTGHKGKKKKNDRLNIVFFGNSAFSDDRDTDSCIVNMVGKRLDANVYNASISQSFLSTVESEFKPQDNPYDCYSPYWMVWRTISDDNDFFYFEAADELKERDVVIPEAEDVLELITTIDMNAMDICVIMYDASDYLYARPPYEVDHETDIHTFFGAMNATLDLLQENYPNLRIIVSSPTYAYWYDGTSSDLMYYIAPLSTYAIWESTAAMDHGVSFIDNIYGVFNEDTADEYLKDNLHLNQKGKELITDRIVEAITYYDK